MSNRETWIEKCYVLFWVPMREHVSLPEHSLLKYSNEADMVESAHSFDQSDTHSLVLLFDSWFKDEEYEDDDDDDDDNADADTNGEKTRFSMLIKWFVWQENLKEANDGHDTTFLNRRM